jgi:hypothetical protein
MTTGDRHAEGGGRYGCRCGEYGKRIREMASAVRSTGVYQSDGDDEADAGHLEDVVLALKRKTDALDAKVATMGPQLTTHIILRDQAEAEVIQLRRLIAEWADACRAINESKSSFDINLMHRLANAEDALAAEGEAQ